MGWAGCSPGACGLWRRGRAGRWGDNRRLLLGGWWVGWRSRAAALCAHDPCWPCLPQWRSHTLLSDVQVLAYLSLAFMAGRVGWERRHPLCFKLSFLPLNRLSYFYFFRYVIRGDDEEWNEVLNKAGQNASIVSLKRWGPSVHQEGRPSGLLSASFVAFTWERRLKPVLWGVTVLSVEGCYFFFFKYGTLHEFACHPCAGAMLIFSVSFQF